MMILEQIPRIQEKSGADDSQVLQYLRIVGGGWADRWLLLMFYKTLKAWRVNFWLICQNLTVAKSTLAVSAPWHGVC